MDNDDEIKDALSDQQITTVFEELLGFPPRTADLAVLHVMHKKQPTTAELADYLWDHMLGEPDDPTLEQVVAAVRKCLTRAI